MIGNPLVHAFPLLFANFKKIYQEKLNEPSIFSSDLLGGEKEKKKYPLIIIKITFSNDLKDSKGRRIA